MYLKNCRAWWCWYSREVDDGRGVVLIDGGHVIYDGCGVVDDDDDDDDVDVGDDEEDGSGNVVHDGGNVGYDEGGGDVIWPCHPYVLVYGSK